MLSKKYETSIIETDATYLQSLVYSEVDLLTNNPDKNTQLTDNGIAVKSKVTIFVETCEYNRSYLRTKAVQMGHPLLV
tara:strand:+ start:51 stop:284 length:234 start_codon:yes stop_codon:yes gene_type:complete